VALYWDTWGRLEKAAEDTTEQRRLGALLKRVFHRMMEAPASSPRELADKAEAFAHWETEYVADLHLSGHPAARLWRDMLALAERSQ